ncbi:Chromatin associated protein KTI12 [Musa troglodytarum]|uniref:Chromatin associated protein KTI12 n=1 Tax=Musa troglodytarum TaxID=320322 RepID=A0A9E7EJR2_9LILI|nr:Chromatin associated protein KTI12 [Musa troglodytarum]
MALVVICGQPCSGKSTAAACLADSLQATDPKPTVRIIDESSLHLGRNQSYAVGVLDFNFDCLIMQQLLPYCLLKHCPGVAKDMPMEKNLRGVLRSEVDRSLSKSSIIIVDSLNNIKGYRYELWCLARASGIRYCVVFCDTDEDSCREWNRKRGEMGESSYDTKIFEDLVRRFEKPDGRNRWDSPLFELFPSKDEIRQSSPVIADAVSYLTKKVDSKSRDVRVLQPTIATQTAHTTDANSLYVMDRATQEVINMIVEAQSQGLAGAVNRISLGQHLPAISFFLEAKWSFSSLMNNDL